MSKERFAKSDSRCLKGIAILLLVFHHCFQKAQYFSGFTIIFRPFTQSQIVNLAYVCKICVAIFSFISGYGLWCSLSETELSKKEWFAQRIFRTFSPYWFVYVLSFLITSFTKNIPHITYFSNTSVFIGMQSLLLDFFGLANLFGTPTLNRTWWYMSAAFVYILFFAVIYKKDNDNSSRLILILFSVIVFPRLLTGGNSAEAYTGQNSPFAFLLAAVFGSLFAEYKLFDRIMNQGGTTGKYIRFVTYAVLIAVSMKAYIALPYENLWELHFAFIPLVFILFFVEFIIGIPYLRGLLNYLGSHSTNIFLTHTYILGTFFHEEIYSLQYWALIILAVIISSLFVSVIIEYLKYLTCYRKFCERLEKRVMTVLNTLA